jgi:hypothetical protein
VLEIKRLLYQERFTIEGARKFLDSRAKPELVAAPAARGTRKKVQGDLFVADRTADLTKLIDKVREELRAIAVSLK